MGKIFALFKPGGRQISGYSYGKLVERRYIDVVRAGIESPERDEFIQRVEQARLTDEELRECRIGYVDDNGIGTYYSWEEFLGLAAESS